MPTSQHVHKTSIYTQIIKRMHRHIQTNKFTPARDACSRRKVGKGPRDLSNTLPHWHQAPRSHRSGAAACNVESVSSVFMCVHACVCVCVIGTRLPDHTDMGQLPVM